MGAAVGTGEALTGLTVQVLGPMAALRDGREVPLGGPKQRAVLAMLALRSDEQVSHAQLMAGLWGDWPPPAALRTLRAYLSRLRAALGPGALVSMASGTAVALTAADVDAVRFRRAMARSHAARAAGDWAEAAQAAQAALAQWRAEALCDLRDLPFAGPAAARLDRDRRDAQHLLNQVRLLLGQHAQLLPQLRRVLDEHPDDEGLTCQLMLALYRCGHQVEALEAYGRLRQRLIRELGIEPGDEARTLHRSILRQEAHLAELVAPAAGGPGRVPRPTTTFVGRRVELRELQGMLGRGPLVTVTGAPGVGKSRLVLELAQALQPSRPVHYVDLAPVQLGRALVPHVATTLGVAERPASALLDTLGRALAAQDRLLLVLDGSDGHRGPMQELVGCLLDRCPGLTMLVTRREPLQTPEERVLALSPLPVQDAVALLVARGPDGAPDEEAAHADLERVATAVDRVPLILELAAAHLGLVGPRELADEVEARQGAVLVWAVDTLAPDERRLLARLSVFGSPVDPERAAAVSGADVEAQLPALLRTALVTVEPRAAGPAYRLPPSVADCARRLLADEGDERATAARHAQAHCELAERADQRLRGQGGEAAMQRLDEVEPDLRAAVEWSLDHDPVTALRLTGALAWHWYRRGRFTEGRAWCEAALCRAPDDAPPQLAARAGVGAAVLAYLAGDLDGMDQLLVQACSKARQAGDLVIEAQAFLARVWPLALSGRLDAARAALDRTWTCLAGSDCGWLAAEAHMTAGMLARATGDVATAEAQLEAARLVARACGHAWASTSATWLQAKLALERGDAQLSKQLHRLCLQDVDVQHDLPGGLVTVNGLAAALAVGGDAARGARLLGAVAALGSRIDYAPEVMDPLDGPRHVRLVRERLSETDWLAACETGRRMTWSGLLAEVNEDSEG